MSRSSCDLCYPKQEMAWKQSRLLLDTIWEISPRTEITPLVTTATLWQGQTECQEWNTETQNRTQNISGWLNLGTKSHLKNGKAYHCYIYFFRAL